MVTFKVWMKKSQPRKVLEWCPPGGRRKGRPRNSWMQEVTTGMREKGISNMEWERRELATWNGREGN